MMEMAHGSCRSQPSYFISHAWRQTFSVSDRDWRGCFVQAVVEKVPEDERATTFFWMDIFSVNQHLKSPYGDGGLLAFAFDPLRNSMMDCDRVLLFLEVFDDPAPLGRVWCLDELRNALLLGKPVEIIMPPQAVKSLNSRVQRDKTTGKSSVIDDIDRVVDRIDVNHASASFSGDRETVLNQVETTIGTSALNRFCKEIMRRALFKVAGLDSEEGRRHEHWGKMFADMLATVHMSDEVPKKIEVQRAVALMQRRIYSKGSTEHDNATELLKAVADEAKRFYGPNCHNVVKDIEAVLDA